MTEITLDREDALPKMRGLIFGFLVTRSVAVAAELGIADRLTDGPRTPGELSRDCGCLNARFTVCCDSWRARVSSPRTKMAVLRSPPLPSCYAPISRLCARLGHRCGRSSISVFAGDVA
jgi:hypothetical protein